MKNLAIPFVFLLVAVTTQCVLRSDSTVTSGDSRKQEGPEQRRDRARRLVSLLSSANETAAKAEKELLELAQQDPESRTIVLHEVVSASEVVLTKQVGNHQEQLVFWRSANRLFQQLHATEAIPLMIKFILDGDGYTGNGNNHYPGQDSLRILGVDSVPALARESINNPDVMTRIVVAGCLGDIGGPQAREALLRAKDSEKNQQVLFVIDRGLETIARESKQP